MSLDLEVVIAADQLSLFDSIRPADFKVEPFEHSVNVSVAGSDLRIQIQTNPRYVPFVDRASKRSILGLVLPVARLEDVLQGKIWAAVDERRSGSKRQKDLADIARILEAYPSLRDRVPPDILARLA